MTAKVDITSQLSVAGLFEAAGIERVICVDDVYAATLETFKQALSGLLPEQRGLVFQEPAEQFEEDEVWQERVRERWDELDPAERASLVDKAYAIEEGPKPPGIGAIHALAAQVPGIELQGLSLKQWREQQAKLIKELGSKTTLILFDQDFHHEGGGSKEGQRAIEELESAIAKLKQPKNVYYGLLTNTAETDQEQERREQIVKESKVNAARLVVISKRNPDEGEEELDRFAQRLRITLLAPIFADLIEEVTGRLHAIQRAAIAQAKQIAPEDMEHMVVRSSDREGDWPPDTLVRVLEAMERAEIRKQLRTDPRVAALTERLQRIAAIAPTASRTPTPPDAGSTPAVLARRPLSTAVGILHAENYDEADHVNQLHLPIELGDLIERPSDAKLWVVVAQPCTLMVRDKGQRKPELTHIILAKIENRPAGSHVDTGDLFELPYYLVEGEEIAVVRLSRTAYVRSIILDSCVLNADGRARLDLNDEPPPGLLPYWRFRCAELKKLGRAMLKRADTLKPDTLEPAGSDSRDLPAEIIMGHYNKLDLFAPKIEPEAHLIEWDCRRAGRVGEAYARALLTRLCQHSARDAYLNDLARQ